MWLRQAGLQSLPPAHIKAACCRSLCKKGSASSEQRQMPGSLCSGSFPVGLIVKPPRLVLSISSLQSRKLLFLIYWDRVKELQLDMTVFNGAAATNEANYEHVKGTKTFREKGCLESWEGMLWDEKSCAACGVVPPQGNLEGPSLGRVVLNQTKQPEDNPCQQGSFGSRVRISSLDNMLKANIFS